MGDILNDQQQAAVDTTEGPVIIIAGPGTGKTKTLATRIGHLVEKGITQPQHILALTFTKKSAQEMAERVGNKQVVISTFHALCNNLLDAPFTFVTETERLQIIRSLPKTLKTGTATIRELALAISLAKTGSQTDKSGSVAAYNAALQERGLIDFDDLLLRTRDMLRDHPNKKPYFTHVLVDEFQDTNELQYELLRLLLSNNNIFVIGDPNQSIYGFRGASETIFDTFKHNFPQYKHIELHINYRSRPEVINAANALFKDGQQLRAHRLPGGKVQAIQLLNEYSEAQWIVNRIQQDIGGSDLLIASHHENPYTLRDFAIIYRSCRVARTIQKYIADSGLPYQIVGEGSPYLQPDVLVLIKLLRACIGEVTAAGSFTGGQVTALLGAIDMQLSPDLLAEQLVTTFKLKKTADVTSFIGMLVRFDDVKVAIDYIDTIAEQNFYDAQAEAITLLTIHAAKGLEFSSVFLVGAEETVLPSDKADIHEERRLFYVAMTRAKDQLAITHVIRRVGEPAKMSRFITEIPEQLLPRVRDPHLQSDAKRLQRRQTKRAQTSLF